MSNEIKTAHQATPLQRVPLAELMVEITEAEIFADLIWPAQP